MVYRVQCGYMVRGSLDYRFYHVFCIFLFVFFLLGITSFKIISILSLVFHFFNQGIVFLCFIVFFSNSCFTYHASVEDDVIVNQISMA